MLELTNIRNITTALCLFSLSSTALAKHHGDKERSGRRGPPPQAIEACSNLSEGDICEFEGRRGNVSGSCFLPPKDDAVLACKPNRGRGEKRDGDTSG